MNPSITIRNARLHNLKNVTLEIPKNQLVVLTGPSGSGKSTLAFDILYKEGTRQYMESLGMVTWGLSKPPVDSIVGLSPSISVDQHLTNHSPRSTVGTVTEVFTYLRILYARLGHRPCPKCGKDIPPSTYELSEENGNASWEAESDESPDETYPCPHCGAPVPEMGMADFSFNKPAGACPTCTGLGVVRQVIINRLIDDNKSIFENAVEGWIEFHINYYSQVLANAGKHFGFEFDLSKVIKDYTPVQRDLFLYGTESQQFRRHFPNVKPPTTVKQGRFEGLVTNLQRRYNEHATNAAYLENWIPYSPLKLARTAKVPACDLRAAQSRSQARVLSTAPGYRSTISMPG